MSLSVLNYGHDRLLLKTRELLLTREGFKVLSTTNRTEADRLLATQKIDLLVPCHSLSEPEFQSILAAAHALAGPPRVLALSTSIGHEIAFSQYAVCNVFDGPGTFLAAVHGLIDPAGPPRPTTQTELQHA